MFIESVSYLERLVAGLEILELLALVVHSLDHSRGQHVVSLVQDGVGADLKTLG